MNIYNAFLNLIPKQTKYIAQVLSIDANGTVVVQSIGAFGVSSVKGGSSSIVVHDYVLIQDGVIITKIDDPQSLISVELI